MAEHALRGAAVAIEAALPEAFYAPGQVTCQLFARDGVTWIAIYRAERDDIGWKVYDTIRKPIDIEGIVRAFAEIIEQKDLDIPHMELLAARLGTPGTDYDLARMKARRVAVCAAQELIAALALTCH